MTTWPILQSGIVPQSRNRAGSRLDTIPQFLQYENSDRSLVAQTEPGEASGSASFYEAREEGASKVQLPLSALLIEHKIESELTTEDVEAHPSTYALSEAKRVVVSAYVALFPNKPQSNIQKPPAPIIGTDEVGGVRISWSLGNKYVVVKFGTQPSSRSFLYFEGEAEHRVLPLDENNLADRLRWIVAR